MTAMDELDVKAEFSRLVEARPPLPESLDPGRLMSRGQRIEHRRHAAWAGAAAALTAAALVAVTLGMQALVGGQPGPARVAAPTTTRIAPPTAVRTTPTPVTLPRLSEAETCPERTSTDYPPGTSARGAGLPSGAAVRAAALAAAPRLLPGARVTHVKTWESRVDPRSGEPRVVVWFDLVSQGGPGGFGFEIYPFRGVTAAALASWDFTARPYSNCTAARRRAEPNGSAGLVYVKPLGNYAKYPNGARGQASYYDRRGVQVNVDTVPWAYSALLAAELHNPDLGVPDPPATRQTLPMTPDQAYQFARLVSQLPLSS
ncbi:MAG TPA: hypothetical protein VMU51_01115 [Mycobacteriales bacterium]|nr:hypothetical protein [Mycobacteriales bacterium]